MESLLIYILRSSVWLILFGSIYFLFLRNERYFFLNRLFLLAGMIASLLFPFITWHYTITINMGPETISAGAPLASAIGEKEINFWTLPNIITGIIILGFVILFSKTAIQTLKIMAIVRHCPIEKLDNIKIVRQHPFRTSFSFFSYVFVNPNLREKEIQEVISHERAHIAQYHWIDLMLIEWIRLIQWFNPMAWLYGQFIRQNHEYLADRAAIHSTGNPAVYKAILLNQMVGGEVISLGNYFNYSLNKKRFIMMTNKSTSIISKLKPLVVLPFIAFVFYAFAEPKYQYISGLEPATNSPGLISDIKGDTIEIDTGVSITISKKEPKEKPLIFVDGKEMPYEALENIEPTAIKKIEVLKDKSAVRQYGDKGKNGVILIQTNLAKEEEIIEARIQKEDKESTKDQPTFFMVEELPEFPGGEKALHDYILANTNYPPKAKEAGIEGRVYIRFIILPNGKVDNIEVARSAHSLLDEEAKRVIAAMPEWKPGKQRGKNVAVQYTLPVNFALNETDSDSDQ